MMPAAHVHHENCVIRQVHRTATPEHYSSAGVLDPPPDGKPRIIKVTTEFLMLVDPNRYGIKKPKPHVMARRDFDDSLRAYLSEPRMMKDLLERFNCPMNKINWALRRIGAKVTRLKTLGRPGRWSL